MSTTDHLGRGCCSPSPKSLPSSAAAGHSVYRLMTSGALPSVIVAGRLRRVRREDLRTYVDSLAVTWPAQ